MSLVPSWTVFLSVSLVIYCAWSFRRSGGQGQAGSAIWWLPCWQLLALPWVLLANSWHIFPGSEYGRSFTLSLKHSCLCKPPAMRTVLDQVVVFAIRISVHTLELLRWHNCLPPASCRSWSLSEHKYPMYNDFLCAGWALDQQDCHLGQPVSIPPCLSPCAVLWAVIALEPVLWGWGKFSWDSSAPFQKLSSSCHNALQIVCLKFGKFNISKILCGCTFISLQC